MKTIKALYFYLRFKVRAIRITRDFKRDAKRNPHLIPMHGYLAHAAIAAEAKNLVESLKRIGIVQATDGNMRRDNIQ